MAVDHYGVRFYYANPVLGRWVQFNPVVEWVVVGGAVARDINAHSEKVNRCRNFVLKSPTFPLTLANTGPDQGFHFKFKFQLII